MANGDGTDRPTRPETTLMAPLAHAPMSRRANSGSTTRAERAGGRPPVTAVCREPASVMAPQGLHLTPCQ